MTDMPKKIYVGRNRYDRLVAFEAEVSAETKYIRADLYDAATRKISGLMETIESQKETQRLLLKRLATHNTAGV